MKITGKGSISNFVEILLKIAFVVGIIVFILLPWILGQYLEHITNQSNEFYWAILIILYITGLPMLIIVYQFIKMFNTLKKATPFIMENVTYLRRASICSGIISLVYLVGVFVFQSVFILVIIGIFLVAWLGLYILSELFKQAIDFKEENELVI
ncbi:MAG: DUF2975 domain-containing protein [Oscillospiraceae bacterium]|nr:DUF2975 domain-containing protein [Oscillospiraceae bacterium]